MAVLEIILGALVLIASLILIFVIILQGGHRQGINGAISGGADTFLSKNKARTVDAFLSKWTKFIAIGFFVLVLAAIVV
ncbi:MAG: preprotein translocase subunit SecG, partial [Oscillospiraceae bacterium]|nr:preprotein translocase subunit SecG [Candidatus Equicaccousia limihippi]